MMFLLRLVARELRQRQQSTVLFIVSLAIGLSALTGVLILRNGLSESLRSESKKLLGADIGLGARRPLTDDEVAAFERNVQFERKTQLIETYSMVRGVGGATDIGGQKPPAVRLLQLRAIDEGFPFYGDLELDGAGNLRSGPVQSALTELRTQPQIWFYPEVLLQMGLKVGDTVRVGKLDLLVSHVVTKDSAGAGRSFSFAPPAYIGIKTLIKADLLKVGSTGFYSWLYRLKGDQDPEALADLLNPGLPDPALRVLTPQRTSEQVGRLMSYFTDYLGLACLLALSLTVFGCGFLYSHYLKLKEKDRALLRVMGLTQIQIRALTYLHVGVLSTIAAVVAVGFFLVMVGTMDTLATDLLSLPLRFTLPPQMVLGLLALSLILGVLVAFPLLATPRQRWWRFVPLGGLFAAGSLWLSQSYRVGGIYVIATGLTVALLAALAVALIRGLNSREWSVTQSLFWIVRRARVDLAGFSVGFVALATAITLTQMLPQVEVGLLKELSTDRGARLPTLFLFDIQEDQLADLKTVFQANPETIQSISPMIRARLRTINGQEFTKLNFSASEGGSSQTRETQEENRTRNRGYNLTYRDQLQDSEKLVSGTYWAPGSSGPDVSLEVRFADRLGLKLGDALTFDVSGIPVTGTVTSLRRVRWSSFQPNFFIQFPESALRDAPKTFLANVFAPSVEAKADVILRLAKSLPNVSVIDIDSTAKRIVALIEQMALALKALSWLIMLVGFLIVYAVLSRKVQELSLQINLLRVLGTSNSQLYVIALGESFFTTAVAALFSTLLAAVFTEVISLSLFDGALSFDLAQATKVFAAVVVIGFFLAGSLSRKVLATTPRELLQDAP
jgi:putative ABC transport system permease protein